jgi:purine-cytosine permease-like protein
MVLSRFSWGYGSALMPCNIRFILFVTFRYFGAVIPSVFNVLTAQGWLIINCIVGGQALASVSPHLNDTLGIVIISLVSLAVSVALRRLLAELIPNTGFLLRVSSDALVRPHITWN